MSQIKSSNTKPELIVRKYLFKKGLRYRLHVKTLPSKPDIVLKKRMIVVFIHGCFWHCHRGCKYFKIPKTRTNWWKMKLSKNAENDQKHTVELQNLGWRILVIWECELKTKNRESALLDLFNKINDSGIMT